jgi:hypothetical protein
LPDPYDLFLIPINPHIAGLPAGGHDVGPAIAVEIVNDEVFTGDASIINNLPIPLPDRHACRVLVWNVVSPYFPAAGSMLPKTRHTPYYL